MLKKWLGLEFIAYRVKWQITQLFGFPVRIGSFLCASMHVTPQGLTSESVSTTLLQIGPDGDHIGKSIFMTWTVQMSVSDETFQKLFWYVLLESAARMFLLHSVVAFALQFYINSQLLLYCFVGLGLASFSDAGVSLLRVWMAGRVNQSVTVPANEVQITFLMLCCPHLHSCIFFVYFHV